MAKHRASTTWKEKLANAFHKVGLYQMENAVLRWAHRTIDGRPLPGALTLAFTEATHIPRIYRLFDRDIKSRIDPTNYVVKRERNVFEDAIERGGGAVLYDPKNGDVHSLTMAYHVKSMKSFLQDKPHEYTEIGTSLTRLAHYRSAPVVAAAIALKEWWEGDNQTKIVTEILPDNVPSLGVYKNKLGWQAVDDDKQIHDMHTLCNESISLEDKNRPTIWFEVNKAALSTMATLVLKYKDEGRLKHSGKAPDIALDLGALDDIGLTRKRLEAVARGHTNKELLSLVCRCA